MTELCVFPERFERGNWGFYLEPRKFGAACAICGKAPSRRCRCADWLSLERINSAPFPMNRRVGQVDGSQNGCVISFMCLHDTLRDNLTREGIAFTELLISGSDPGRRMLVRAASGLCTGLL
jgi:hypothetical protein